jgi:soluble lytic murein transglycosylase-like protein
LSAVQRPLLCAVLGLLLLACAPARAEVWAYVDARGGKHFADHQVNRHYELFFKGGASSAAAAGDTRRARLGSATVNAAFEISIGYKAVQHHIREAAAATGVEYELLKAVISAESNFNARAVSPMGAVGLMQLLPATAQRFGVRAKGRQSVEQRLTDPRTNVNAGARYLSWLLNRFGGETKLALAAYNAGEGAVDRAGRQVPNYRETQNYVRKVMRLHQDLRPPEAVLLQRAALRRAKAQGKPLAQPL